MAENTEINSQNIQENSEKSENIQQNSEINTQPEDNSEPQNSENSTATAEEKTATAADDSELEIPEPDIPEEEQKKKKEPPEWMKKKLERERRREAEKLAAEESEKARLREENERLRGHKPQNTQPHQPDPYMPQRENFESDGEYFLALSDYRENKRQQEALFHQRQQQIQKHEAEFKQKLTDAIDTGKTKYKDFEERTDYILYGDGFPSNRAMAEAIVDSEYKDDILYFLGTHVREAERIANLNPVSAAKEIAKIEVRFASKRKSNISKAPNPLTPVGQGGQGGRGSGTHKDPNNMEMDEFTQWYKEKFGG